MRLAAEVAKMVECEMVRQALHGSQARRERTARITVAVEMLDWTGGMPSDHG
jgi:acid phosphatase family membrane protein YuiD